MKKLLLALALVLAPVIANAQCTGVFPAGSICGNSSSSAGVPSATTNPVIGTPPIISIGGATSMFQINSTGSPWSLSTIGYGATGGGSFAMAYTRGASPSVQTIVQVNDILGEWFGYGSDGVAYQQAALIFFSVDAAPASGSMPGRITFNTTKSGATTTSAAMRIDSNQAVWARSSTGGFGYGPPGNGVGASVTQLTNKSTAVTINNITGQIVMNNAALAAGTSVAFQVNNNTVTANDTVILSTASGTSGYLLTANRVLGGSFFVVVFNASGGSLSEALTLEYSVIRGSVN